jgi:hypothetical protein
MTLELSTTEQSELEALEIVINKNMTSFYQVGSALAKIRDSKLYRETYSTFEDYCKDRWDMSRPRAYQLIDSSIAIDSVSTMVDKKPINERQTRPLTKLKTPEQQQAAWKTVIETAPEGKITASHVSRVVSKIRKESTENEVKKQVDKQRSFSAKKFSENDMKGNISYIVDEEMNKAFENFYREIQRARLEKWVDTPKEAALYMLKLINDLIMVD